MKDRTITLQDYVSRPESLKQQISELSWQRGIENFFLEHIPFSYSTSHEYANRIVELIKKHYDIHQQKNLTIFEIGSGSGLLCYRILDILHQQNLPFAKDIHVIITDFSESIINDIKESGLFKQFPNQVSFEVFNFVTDDYSIIKECDFVLMTYLLGAIPHHHLEYNNKKLQELKVKTTISHDYHYIDTSHFPPVVKTKSDIKNTLISQLKDNSLESLSRCRENIDEVYKSFPVSSSSPLHQSNYLAAFLNQHKKKSFKFNFSELVCDALNRLCTHLSDSALVVIYDFGVTNFDPLQDYHSKICAKYGITLFYSTFFPLIDFISAQHGLHCLQTHFKPGDSQSCIITRSKTDYKEQFINTFSEEGALKSVDILNKLNTFPHSDNRLLDFITSELESCTEFEKQSHTLLLSIAIKLKNLKYYDEALKYINNINDLYGDFSLSSIVLTAEIYNGQKDFKKTVALLEPLTKQYMYYNGLFYQLLVAYIYLNEQEKFISTFKHFLLISDNFVPWRFFIIMACFYNELHQQDYAILLLNYLINHYNLYPSLIDIDSFNTSQKLIKQWTGQD